MKLDWKRNDTRPITGTLKLGGKKANLDGATLRWKSRPSPVPGGPAAPVIDRVIQSLQGVDPVTGRPTNEGRFSYPPVAGDVNVAGVFDAEVEVTWGDGTVKTFPTDGYLRWVISDDLG